jgi:hypothetical protein
MARTSEPIFDLPALVDVVAGRIDGAPIGTAIAGLRGASRQLDKPVDPARWPVAIAEVAYPKAVHTIISATGRLSSGSRSKTNLPTNENDP